jgi:hypothetical protein
MSYANQEKQAINHPPSDGSELIPAEVQAKEASQSLNTPLEAGYTIDEEGNLNNYAIEPKMSKAEYPSPEQQRRYIFLGAAAILLVAFILWIAFAAS